MPTNIVAFSLTVLVLAIVPGANNATITRQVLQRGRVAGMLTVAGTSTGILMWATAGSLGISAVLLARPVAFEALRYFGAALLAGLGVQALVAARRVCSEPTDSVPQRPAAHRGRKRRSLSSYGLGVLSSLGNPKAGVIAVALLPQFVTATGPVTLSMIALGVLWAAVSGSWFMTFVWFVDHARDHLASPRAVTYTQRVNGIGLLSLAAATVLL